MSRFWQFFDVQIAIFPKSHVQIPLTLTIDTPRRSGHLPNWPIQNARAVPLSSTSRCVYSVPHQPGPVAADGIEAEFIPRQVGRHTQQCRDRQDDDQETPHVTRFCVRHFRVDVGQPDVGQVLHDTLEQCVQEQEHTWGECRKEGVWRNFCEVIFAILVDLKYWMI